MCSFAAPRTHLVGRSFIRREVLRSGADCPCSRRAGRTHRLDTDPYKVYGIHLHEKIFFRLRSTLLTLISAVVNNPVAGSGPIECKNVIYSRRQRRFPLPRNVPFHCGRLRKRATLALRWTHNTRALPSNPFNDQPCSYAVTNSHCNSYCKIWASE